MAEKESYFSRSIREVRSEITLHFDKLIEGLTERKTELLAALDALDEYRSKGVQDYRDKLKKIGDVEDVVEATFEHNLSFDSRVVADHKELNKKHSIEINEKIRELEASINIEFKSKFNVNEYILASGCVIASGGNSLDNVLEELDISSHLIEIPPGEEIPADSMELSLTLDQRKYSTPLSESLSYDTIDSTKSLPSDLSSSTRVGNFKPSAIAIEPDTCSIYAVDGSAPRIIVFTNDGEFSKVIIPKLPKLSNKTRFYGISIARGRMYVSDTANSVILAISLQNGDNLYRSVKVSSLNNLDVDKRDGEVFACDKRGMKIQTFDEFLKIKKPFGDRLLQGPTDVKVRGDKVIVLDNGDFALRFFTKKGLLLGENITFQSQNDTLFIGRLFYSSGKRVEFFDIDAEGNAYISDYKSAVIRKFDVFGGQVGQFGREKSDESMEGFQTKGIAIDKQGRVVCISNKVPEQIQCFCAETLEPSSF